MNAVDAQPIVLDLQETRMLAAFRGTDGEGRSFVLGMCENQRERHPARAAPVLRLVPGPKRR